MAQISGARATVLKQSFDGTTATCSWSIPSSSAGKTLDGIAAAKASNGVWYYAGFDLPIN
jgi:hypothetical protein